MSIFKLESLLENQLQAAGELDPNAPNTRLHFASGQTVVIPTALLVSAAAEPEAHNGSVEPAANAAIRPDEETIIPLVEEQLEISKRVVETARVRLTRSVEEFTRNVSMPLTEVKWEIEHIPVDQIVTERPEPRQVGETTIFPLLEERLVVRRELFLREEVHVRKVSTTVEKSADFTLKRDVLTEERVDLPRE